MVAAGPASFDPKEADLAARAKERSSEAWTEIYNQHYAAIFRYVHARVFEKETTEDLTASVFLAAIKSIDSYKYRGQPLLAWLYRIARNVVSSHQRHLLGRRSDLPRRMISRLMRRSQPQADEDAPEEINAADRRADPALLVERMDLREALSKVTPAQREIVILRFFVGLNTQEIAALLEKEAAAIYSLESRAMVALRNHLREEIR